MAPTLIPSRNVPTELVETLWGLARANLFFLPVAALASGIVARVHGAQRIFAKFPSMVSGAPKGEGVGEVGVRVRPVY